MESVANPCHSQYQSILGGRGNTASSAQVTSGVIRNVNTAPLFRRFGSLVVLAVIVSVLAFVAGRAGIIDRHNGFRSSRLYPALAQKLHDARHFYSIDRPGGGPTLSNYHSMSRPLNPSYASRVDLYSSRFDAFVQSDASSTVEDFALDERVPTGQCSKRRLCRARLTLVKEGSQVVIKAGYYIYIKDGSVRTVSEETKSKLKKTTPTQARKWASTLLEGASARLAEVKCTVTVDEIAKAIMDGKNTVLSCPKTGDSRCDALETIRECTLPEPREVDPCAEFVKSSSGVDSLAALQVECPTAQFYYNRVGVSLPFCTTECSSNAGVTHTVYMDFYIQSNNRADNKADCVSATLIPAYQNYGQKLPACDSTPPGETDEGIFIIDVASSDQGNAPKEVLDVAESYGCAFTYAFFVGAGNSVESIVDASCAAQ